MPHGHVHVLPPPACPAQVSLPQLSLLEEALARMPRVEVFILQRSGNRATGNVFEVGERACGCGTCMRAALWRAGCGLWVGSHAAGHGLRGLRYCVALGCVALPALQPGL